MQRVSIVILYLLIIGLTAVVAQLWTSAPDATVALVDEDVRVLRQELREVRNDVKELGYKTLQQQAALNRLDAEFVLRASASPAVSAPADPTITAVDTIATLATTATVHMAASATPAGAAPALPAPPAAQEPSLSSLVDDVMAAADENVAEAEAGSDARKSVVFSTTTTGTYMREGSAAAATLIADVVATAQQVFAATHAPQTTATDSILARMDIADLVSTAAAPATMATLLDTIATKTAEVARVISGARAALQDAIERAPQPAAQARSTAVDGADQALPGATPRTSTRAGTRAAGPGYVIDLSRVAATSITVRAAARATNAPARRAAIEITPDDLAPARDATPPRSATARAATPAAPATTPTKPTRVTSVPSISAEPDAAIQPRPSRRARAEQAQAAMDVTLNLTDRLVPGATGQDGRPVTMSDIMDVDARKTDANPPAEQ